MSTALFAVALAAAAAVAAVAVRGDSGGGGGGAVASYTLNGQNVEWPCASTKKAFADTGRYAAKNVIATRVQVWGDRAFVLTPRYRAGVPFTVSAVRLDCRDRCWPALSPYPCWAQHDESDPDAVQNAVDMYLDPTGVLWLLDAGVVNTVEQPVRRTQPRIFGIDVNTDKVVKRIDLSTLVCSASRLNYITADYGDDGRPFVYVSDAATRAVIVWEVDAARGYRVVLPKAITHDCTGRRDVLYVALAQRAAGDNVLYLTYLTSNRMYAIDTCRLRRACSQGAVADLGPKPEKMVMLGTDGRTALYFRYRGQGDVYAWDTDGGPNGTSPFARDRFALVRKADDCGRLATHVAPGHRGGVLWILESNFPDYVAGTVGCLGANVRLQPLVDQCGNE